MALPALLAGCVRGIEPEENSMRVKLNAGIAMSPVATKAGGPYDTDSPDPLDIRMLRTGIEVRLRHGKLRINRNAFHPTGLKQCAIF